MIRIPRPHRTPSIVPRLLPLCLCGLLALAGAASASAAPPAGGDTLVVVNEDVITASDLDGMIMKAHKSFDMREEQSGIVHKLINKRINDLLIMQDAYAAGINEEKPVLEREYMSLRNHAVKAYVKDNLVLEDEPPEEAIREFFETYYWQIQLRRVSVRTMEEAVEARQAVLGGADMEAMAREISLDTKKNLGGLYNLMYWADMENRIRDRAIDLKKGEVSEIFPYNEAFTFVRVEERLPVDEAAYDRVRPAIVPQVRAQRNQETWDSFVGGLTAALPVRESMAGLMNVVSDSALVLKGEFLREDPDPIIWIEGSESVTGTRLRKTISSETMQNGLAPFAENMETARRKEIAGIVLAHEAKQGGYFDLPEVQTKVAEDVEELMLQIYLTDTVGSRITFKQSEFDEFYEENAEKFRGPEQVRLDILMLHDEAEAQSAAARLAEGADFKFMFEEYNPGQDATLGQSRYIALDQLSAPFRDALVDMTEGQSSGAIKMSAGWMIFRLVDRREGELAPMDRVEMEIRRVIFQTKFNTYMDEHLDLLKEHSDIREWPERIEAYILSGSEGG